MKKILIVIGIVILLAGVSYYATQMNTPEQSQAPLSTSPASLSEEQARTAPRIEVVTQNLTVPWDMVFLPNGSMLITERPGRVRLIDPSGKLQEEPVATLSNVNQTGESGLHGIALHPDFENNNYLYLYYTYAGTENNTLNRVSRFTLQNNTLQNEQIIVDEIPGASNHDGGRIRFGPDDFLYISTGDASDPSLAQNKNSLAGKILRVTDDGKAAPGNPFNNRAYSLGHRNPQGLTWSESGELYSTEHGRSGVQSGLDELNRIEAGGNYGWPTIEGDAQQNGLVTPLLNSGSGTTWAPASAAYLEGAVYFTGLRGQSLYKATLQNTNATLESFISSDYGRLRNVIVGPDGLLYVSTSNRDGRGIPRGNDDQILRINPTKL